MSDGRQEPTISLALEEEDIAQRARPKAPPVPERSGGGGGGFLQVVLSIMVLALAAAAYYFYDQLVLSQQIQKLSAERLDALEERLSAAGENLQENSLTTQVKLKELDSEVRKLWDNVWKKQKDELASLSAALDKQAASLKKVESGLATEKRQSSSLSADLKALKKDREEFMSVAGKIDRVIAQAEVNRKQLLDVNKQLTAGGSLDARVAELERQLKQSEEWLDSVNAFRRQVNRDLESLRQAMSQYHSASPQPN